MKQPGRSAITQRVVMARECAPPRRTGESLKQCLQSHQERPWRVFPFDRIPIAGVLDRAPCYASTVLGKPHSEFRRFQRRRIRRTVFISHILRRPYTAVITVGIAGQTAEMISGKAHQPDQPPAVRTTAALPMIGRVAASANLPGIHARAWVRRGEKHTLTVYMKSARFLLHQLPG